MGFLMALLCYGFLASAQVPFTKDKKAEKPTLFASLPPKLTCNKPELEKILQYAKSDQISIKLSDHLILSGEVIEKVETSPGIQSMNIRLSNYGNALLHVSIFRQADNTNKIVGRVIHPKHADALEIAEENGKYYVTKHKMEFFMVE